MMSPKSDARASGSRKTLIKLSMTLISQTVCDLFISPTRLKNMQNVKHDEFKLLNHLPLPFDEAEVL